MEGAGLTVEGACGSRRLAGKLRSMAELKATADAVMETQNKNFGHALILAN
jgi:hypothetical protein